MPIYNDCYAVEDKYPMKLAHTYSQSRALLLDTHEYRFSFAKSLHRPIPFNPQRDTLFMSDLETLNVFLSEAKNPLAVEIHSLRSLAICTTRLAKNPSSVDAEELNQVLAWTIFSLGRLADVMLVSRKSKALLDHIVALTGAGFNAYLELCRDRLRVSRGRGERCHSFILSCCRILPQI